MSGRERLKKEKEAEEAVKKAREIPEEEALDPTESATVAPVRTEPSMAGFNGWVKIDESPSPTFFPDEVHQGPGSLDPDKIIPSAFPPYFDEFKPGN